MKNKARIAKILPLFVVLLSAMFIGDSVNASSDYGITSIAQSPTPLIFEENLTITVVFYDTTNISTVKLLICTITPEFLCESQPITMVEITSGTYEGKFLIDDYAIGTTVGYHLILTYENFTSIIIPDAPEFLEMEIIEPITGFYFFDAGAVQQRTEEAGCCGIIGATLAVLSTSLIAKRKRKNINE